MKLHALHPGLVLQEYLEENNISYSRFAKLLDVDVLDLELLCLGRKDMSRDIVAKLSIVTPYSYRDWNDMRVSYKRSRDFYYLFKEIPIKTIRQVLLNML